MQPMVLVPLPLVGLLAGLMAWMKIRRSRDQLTGEGLAMVGTLGCGLMLVAGSLIAAWTYATEVPEGYSRISFVRMTPDEFELAEGKRIPEEIQKLNGQQVFIKGYMRPSNYQYGLRNFLLVRDNQNCCFGPLNDVKYFDQIQVNFAGDIRADYDTGIFRLGGTLRINPNAIGSAHGEPVFMLVGDYLKK